MTEPGTGERRRPWRGWGRFQEAGLVAVIVLVGAILTLFGGQVRRRDPATGQVQRVNRFLQLDNLDALMKDTSFFAIMAVGATLVIISGGIDLSVGSVYCLSAVAGAMFLHHFGPRGAGAAVGGAWVVPSAIALCLAVGAACGLLNGLMVVGLRLHPFIVTLGTMGAFRGVAFVMTKAQSYTHFPAAFTDGLIRYKVGALYPVPMAVMVLVTVGGAFVLALTPFGRHVYAVGGNAEASRLSGLRVRRIRVGVFTLAGLTAGVAATIMLGYYGSGSSAAGKGYELEVIAACVVGGASLSGGRGTALGALLGALLIRMIDRGIIILGIDQNYSLIIIGGVIIAAAALDRLSTAMRARGR